MNKSPVQDLGQQIKGRLTNGWMDILRMAVSVEVVVEAKSLTI